MAFDVKDATEIHWPRQLYDVLWKYKEKISKLLWNDDYFKEYGPGYVNQNVMINMDFLKDCL